MNGPRARDAFGQWPAWAAVAALAVLLRAWQLGSESAWYDETLTLPYLSSDGLRAYWTALRGADTVPALTPLHPLAAYAWAQAFGPGLMASRLFSMACGLACVPLAGALGARLFGVRAGLIAALLLACSLPHVFYSQEVRRYAIEQLAVLGAFAALVEAQHRRRGAWTAHLALTALMPWASTFALAVLPAMAILVWGAAGDAGRMRRCAVWCAVAGGSALAYALYAAAVPLAGVAWQAGPGWRELVNVLVVLAGGRFSNENPAPWLPGGVSFDLVLAGLLHTIAAFHVLRWRTRERMALALWLWGPPLVWFAFAVWVTPAFMHRYVLFSAFPLCLLAGGALLRPTRFHNVLLAAIAAMMLYQASVVWTGPFRPDYRGAWQAMQKTAWPVVVLKGKLNGAPMAYAMPHGERRAMHYVEGEEALLDGIERGVREEGGCWAVLWRWDRMDSVTAGLDARGIAHRLHRLGGMPPLMLIEAYPASGSDAGLGGGAGRLAGVRSRISDTPGETPGATKPRAIPLPHAQRWARASMRRQWSSGAALS